MSKDSKSKICEACGAPIPDSGRKYCEYCGTRTDGTEPENKPVQAPRDPLEPPRPAADPVKPKNNGEESKRLAIWLAAVVLILLIYILKH